MQFCLNSTPCFNLPRHFLTESSSTTPLAPREPKGAKRWVPSKDSDGIKKVDCAIEIALNITELENGKKVGGVIKKVS